MSSYSTNTIPPGTAGNQVGTNQKTTGSNSLASVDGSQFMTLLLAEMKNQDPLEPMDNKDLMNQITSLNSLTQLQNINSGIETLNKSNQLTEAAGLIGKTVKVKTDDEQEKSGVVTGVSLVKGEIMLWMGDYTAPISNLETISASS